MHHTHCSLVIKSKGEEGIGRNKKGSRSRKCKRREGRRRKRKRKWRRRMRRRKGRRRGRE